MWLLILLLNTDDDFVQLCCSLTNNQKITIELIKDFVANT